MSWPGVAPARLPAALREATQDLDAVLGVAAEIGTTRIEPSHLLVVLARMPGGLANALFARADIPVDVFVDALRAETGRADAAVLVEVDEAALSADARALAGALADAPGDLGEPAVLAAVLDRLDLPARRLLEDFGGVDLDDWIAEATRGPRAPLPVAAPDGTVDEAAFTPAARAVLAALRAEAAAGGHRTPGTLLLLHAMAGAPRGLIEQGAVFAGYDVRDVRTRALLLLGRGSTGHRTADRRAAERPLTLAGISTALRTVLQHAAVVAAERGASAVAEADLLEGLLRAPGGSAAAVLTAAGADPERLRRYAATLHEEPEPEGAPEQGPATVAEAQATLRRALIGQPEVLDRVLPLVARIRRAVRRNFRMGDRPLATFLFCGPSGTGKTMTARLLAEAIHGSADRLIVFEMGQFNSRESINTFIGAPPGYVGFGEGMLTNGLARMPRCVLLFDEVEKAHRLVLDALLRLLDEGQVNDPAGPVRDARDTVIVLTSNCGARQFADLTRHRLRDAAAGRDDPFRAALDAVLEEPDAGGAAATGAPPSPTTAGSDEAVRRELRAELEGFLRPELLNRVDETVLFSPFTPDDLTAIAEAGLARRAADVRDGLGVALRWDAEVPHQVVRSALRQRVDEAARGVNRCVDVVLDLVLAALDDDPDLPAGVPAARPLRIVVTADDTLDVVDDGG